MKTIFLYELNRNQRFTLENDINVYTLETIDGMYSRCFDEENNLIHFAAFTKVHPI